MNEDNSKSENSRIHNNKQNIIFHHNPNSFFYMSALANDEMPSKLDCENINPNYESNEWIDKCNAIKFPENSETCKKVAFCKNFKRVEELYGKRNDYSATGQLYLDNNEEYKKTYNKLISLSAGIVFFTYLTVKKIFQ